MEELKEFTEKFKEQYDAFMAKCEAFEKTGAWDTKEYGNMANLYKKDLVSIVVKLISADGSFDDQEVAYLNEFFGLEYTVETLKMAYAKDIQGELAEGSGAAHRLIKKADAALSAEYKKLIVLIGGIILASDGVATDREKEMVAKLQGLDL